MDLPALQIIPFLYGNGPARLWASPCWQGNGLVRTDSVLAYGHRGWRLARIDTGQKPRQKSR